MILTNLLQGTAQGARFDHALNDGLKGQRERGQLLRRQLAEQNLQVVPRVKSKQLTPLWRQLYQIGSSVAGVGLPRHQPLFNQ